MAPQPQPIVVRAVLAAILGLCLVDSGTAWAAPGKAGRRPAVSADKVQEAERLVSEAANLYQQNRYPEAISLFERAYTLDPHPTILLNIGRAYNRNGGIEQALYYYRLYLQRDPNASDRAQIAQRVRELEGSLGQAPFSGAPNPNDPPVVEPLNMNVTPLQAPATPPEPKPMPPPTRPPVAERPPEVPAVADPDQPREEKIRTSAPSPARPFRIQVEAGSTLPRFEPKVDDGITPTLVARAGLSLALGTVYAAPVSFGFIDLGLAFRWSPMKYMPTSGSSEAVLSQFLGGFVSVAIRAAVTDVVFLGPSLAVGSYWWAGLGANNPFTGMMKADPIPLPTVRVGLPIIGKFGEHLLLGIDAGYSFSKTTGYALTDQVNAIHRLELSGIVAIAF